MSTDKGKTIGDALHELFSWMGCLGLLAIVLYAVGCFS